MRDVHVRVVAVLVTAMALVLTGDEPRAAQGQEESEYEIRILRGLGGNDARGNSINEWGMVSGYSTREGDPTRRAMAWIVGRPFELGDLGGPESNAVWSGQNSTGLVVGIAQTRKPQTRADGWSCRGFFTGPDAQRYVCQGFAWEWGRMRRLRGLGGDNSFATSANNLRQVVGWAETNSADHTCQNPGDRGFLAVLWDLNEDRTVPLMPYRKDKASAATAINDRGQVVGISGACDQSIGRQSARHAVLWENGTATDLGSLGGTAVGWNTPTAISQRGDMIVGFVNAPGADPLSPRLRAVLWTKRNDVCSKAPGTNVCDLGTLDEGGTAQAWAVNDRGQVVGSSCTAAGCKAFLWENGILKDLNALKGDATHHLENAMDVNNFGQISGRARTATGGGVAFVATPRR
jgi:probable HAF family extracellular repeat protein